MEDSMKNKIENDPFLRFAYEKAKIGPGSLYQLCGCMALAVIEFADSVKEATVEDPVASRSMPQATRRLVDEADKLSWEYAKKMADALEEWRLELRIETGEQILGTITDGDTGKGRMSR